jgi:hypothetical protein
LFFEFLLYPLCTPSKNILNSLKTYENIFVLMLSSLKLERADVKTWVIKFEMKIVFWMLCHGKGNFNGKGYKYHLDVLLTNFFWDDEQFFTSNLSLFLSLLFFLSHHRRMTKIIQLPYLKNV